MGDIYAGLGGLFGGLDRGLQMLIALRNTQENQRIAQERTDLDKQQEARVAGQQAIENQRMPYLNQQDQLNKQGITAGYGDIVREYEGPRMEDFLPPSKGFEAPEFGAAPTPAPARGDLMSGVQESLRGADAAIGRSRRQSGQLLDSAGYDARKSILTDVLNEASRTAQTTQLPVSGRFDTGRGEATLPPGFSAQPDKTFTPYQLSGRPDPMDNIFGPLLNNPANAIVLQQLDPVTYQQFLKWKARRVGGGGEGGGGAPPPAGGGNVSDDPQPGESAEDYARRVGNKLGGAEARRRYQAANPNWRP